MDIMTYQEVKELVESNYTSALSLSSIPDMGFFGATSRILDELDFIIQTSEIEKIMIFIHLAKIGIDNDNLRDDIRNEIVKTIRNNTIADFENKVDKKDIEDIKKDLNNLKLYLKI